VGHSTPENQRRFSDACNVVSLVACDEVVHNLYRFQEVHRVSNVSRTGEERDEALTALIRALRRDLGLPRKGTVKGLRYRLWGTGRCGRNPGLEDQEVVRVCIHMKIE
jgi:hypothetical protein